MKRKLGTIIILAAAAGVIYLGTIGKGKEVRLTGGFTEPIIQSYATYPPEYPAEFKKELVKLSLAKTAVFPDGRLETTVQYESANSAEKIYGLYRKSLEENGWTVADGPDRAALLSGTRSREEVVFRLTASGAQSTKVEIVYKGILDK